MRTGAIVAVVVAVVAGLLLAGAAGCYQSPTSAQFQSMQGGSQPGYCRAADTVRGWF